jgi:hypothetical protein
MSQNTPNSLALASVANLVCETARSQAMVASLLAQHLPNLNEREKQTLLEAGKQMNMQVLNLQYSVTRSSDHVRS